jgi:hypothetical protein
LELLFQSLSEVVDGAVELLDLGLHFCKALGGWGEDYLPNHCLCFLVFFHALHTEKGADTKCYQIRMSTCTVAI